MRAGPMRYKLQLLEPVRVEGALGSKKVSYEVRQTVSAERVRLSGQRSDQVGEHFPDYSARFNIRDFYRVDENWRVRQLGGHLYNVVAIEPNRERGFLTLICDRVNE